MVTKCPALLLLAGCGSEVCFVEVDGAAEVGRVEGGWGLYAPGEAGGVMLRTSQDWDGSGTVEAIRVGADLTALGEPVTVATAREPFAASAAWGDGLWMVVWTDDDGLWARPLDDSLAPLGDAQRIEVPDGSAFTPAVAWDGEAFGILVAVGFGNTDMYFARVSPEGQRLLDLQLIADEGHAGRPLLVWNGQSYGALWRGENATDWPYYFLAMDRLGLSYTQQSLGDGISWNTYGADLAWSGEEWWVGWGTDAQDLGLGGGSVFVGRISASGGLRVGDHVLRFEEAVGSVTLAPNDDRHHVFWTREDGVMGAMALTPDVYIDGCVALSSHPTGTSVLSAERLDSDRARARLSGGDLGDTRFLDWEVNW